MSSVIYVPSTVTTVNVVDDATVTVSTTTATDTQVVVSNLQGPQGAPGAGGALGYYGAFYSSATQTLTAANTAYAMTLNNTAEASGVSIVSNSRITFASAGTYNIQFSAQVDRTNSGTDTLDIWFRKNGVDLVQSDTTVTVSGGAASNALVPSWNYLLTVADNDYIQIMWSATDNHVRLLANAAGTSPTRPAVPSVIVTAQQVMYTQVGPTGPTGPSGVIAVNAPITNAGTSTSANLSVSAASTSASGVVQLSDSTSTTSSVLASTPTATKAAYDLANTANTTANAATPTTRTISTTAPLTGGGDLSANRTLSLNLGSSVTTSGSNLIVDSTVVPYLANANSFTNGQTVTVASGTTVPLTIQNNGTGNSFVVNDVASDTTPFVIDASGSVGIGAASPSSQLTVGANPPTAGAIAAVGASGGISLALSDNVNNSLYVRHVGGGAGAILGTDAGGSLRFATGGNTATEERMRIDNAGNVGIGTTAPASQLQINAAASTKGLVIKSNLTTPDSIQEWQDSTSAVKASVDSSGVLNTYSGFRGYVSGAETFSFGISANGGIELGKTNGSTSTPFIDFHSGATAVDYDVRMIASGGTGTSGGGTLTVTGGTLALPAGTTIGGNPINGTWANYTPTWTNFTVGNGSVVSRYSQIGKVVFVNIIVALGSTSSVTGIIYASLPVTGANMSNIGNYTAGIYDSTPFNIFMGTAFFNSTTQVGLKAQNSAGTYLTSAYTSSTVPMTWASGDGFQFNFNYEAA